MPVETANFNGTSSLTWTSTARNVLGARGIDALSTETSGGTVSTYPLYDTHGNVKAYVKKEASNTWSSLGWKQYNVWGGVRSSSGGAGTSSAYVGNLGHVSDLETGLIYMRARYYAPWAGRFISEDSKREGVNWFRYGEGNPVRFADYTGENALGAGLGAFFLFLIMWAPNAEGSSTLRNGLKFIEAFISGLATGYLAGTQVMHWTQEAANSLVGNFIHSKGGTMKGFPQTARAILNYGAAAGFYLGYTLFLAFAMYELDEWVMGVTE